MTHLRQCSTTTRRVLESDLPSGLVIELRPTYPRGVVLREPRQRREVMLDATAAYRHAINRQAGLDQESIDKAHKRRTQRTEPTFGNRAAIQLLKAARLVERGEYRKALPVLLDAAKLVSKGI